MPYGLTMSKPLSLILVDLYIYYFEIKLIKRIIFQFYCTYVDESFALLHTSISPFGSVLTILNLEPVIKLHMKLKLIINYHFLLF